MPWSLIIVLLIALAINVWVTRRIVVSTEATYRKIIFVLGVWFVPLLGALLVLIGIGPSPLPPSSRPDDSNIPWVG